MSVPIPPNPVPMSSTERTCIDGGVTSLSSTMSRYPPWLTPIRTSLPSGVHAGTPCAISTQTSSVSVASSVVAPVSGSTERNSTRFWSRLCSAISGGPAALQCAVTR